MRTAHFETFQPHCLVCRAKTGTPAPLRLEKIFRQADDQILEGILQCDNLDCQFEYPILDGVPLLVPNLREYLASATHWIMQRDDLNPLTVSLLRDGGGQEGYLHQMHQQLSSYGWCHYGDLDPENSDPAAGSTRQLWSAAVDLNAASGPSIDIGCSLGRTTLETAQATSTITLGVDFNFAAVRQAANVLTGGRISFPLRRIGIAYQQRELKVDFANRKLVDFWVCDAHDLPLADATFAQAISLNTLDSVHAPVTLLQSIARIVRPGGRITIALPFDWSSHVTPIEGWLGGHSQRASHEARGDEILRRIFAAQSPGLERLKIHREQDDLEWVVRNHDRSKTVYRVYSVELEKL